MVITLKICQDAVEKSYVVKDNLDAMSNMVLELADINTQIASSTFEQLSVVDKVTRNMANMKTVVEWISRACKGSTRTSSELDQANSKLSGIVNRFNIG